MATTGALAVVAPEGAGRDYSAPGLAGFSTCLAARHRAQLPRRMAALRAVHPRGGEVRAAASRGNKAEAETADSIETRLGMPRGGCYQAAFERLSPKLAARGRLDCLKCWQKPRLRCVLITAN
jgi:hypothetical protein